MTRIALLTMALACGYSLAAQEGKAAFTYSTTLTTGGVTGANQVYPSAPGSPQTMYYLTAQSGNAVNGNISVLTATANPSGSGFIMSSGNTPVQVVVTVTITDTTTGNTGVLLLDDILSGAAGAGNGVGNYQLAGLFSSGNPLAIVQQVTTVTVDSFTFSLPTFGTFDNFAVNGITTPQSQTPRLMLTVSSAVPEPASILLVGLGGLASVACVHRRGRRRSAGR